MRFGCLLIYFKYSNTCLKRPVKNRQNKDLKLMTNGSLMKVESIAEHSAKKVACIKDVCY